MRKVIKNKLYDTETAKRVGQAFSDYPVSDFHYWEETLFLKKTGEYFLYAKGGAASKYNRQLGQNEWCGDVKIIPITAEQAREWAECNLEVEDYAYYFGLPEE